MSLRGKPFVTAVSSLEFRCGGDDVIAGREGQIDIDRPRS
jgi:hypothetical protein